jgi:hypothetical protein
MRLVGAWLILAGALSPVSAEAHAPPGLRPVPILLAQGQPRTVVLSQNEVRNERIATDAAGLLQVLFADGTTLTLGPNSEVVVDSFMFDPSAGTARLQATLTRGVFRFIGGRTSRTPDGVVLSTPFGTLAIVNAGADISLGQDGQPPHFDLVFGDEMTLSRGGTALAEARRPGYSIVPDSGGASVQKTPAEWRSALQEQLS